MHRISANFAVGLNWPVSIELIVFLDTPTISANRDCDNPALLRYSFNLFFNINDVSFSIIIYFIPKTIIPQKQHVPKIIPTAA